MASKSLYKYSIAQSTDIALVEDLHSEIFGADEYEDASVNWIIWARRPDGCDWFAVGFCGVKLLYSEKAAFLIRSGVARGHRGQGLQRRAIRVRDAFLLRAGFPTSLTYVLQENVASLINLLKCGYRIYEPDYAWVGREGIYYLIKKL
jgi:hypothetical protein